MTKLEERLTEIMQLAGKLGWIFPIPTPNTHGYSYPLMQLSEIEKCMQAMSDDFFLQRMRDWVKEDSV